METSRYIILIGNVLMPLVPFLVGILRWGKLNVTIRPLVLILGAALTVEIFRVIQLYNFYADAGWPVGLSLLGYNLYVLFISIAYTLLFKNFGLFGKYKKLPVVIIFSFVVIWVIEHLIIKGFQIHSKTTYFRLCYATVLCIYAIQQINILIVTEKRTLIKNSSFLICMGLLFFFIPYIITEGIFLFNSKPSLDFGNAVSLLRKWTIVLMYLNFTLAILWIPPKKPFIQLS